MSTKIEMTQEEKEILVGTLLGKGEISRGRLHIIQDRKNHGYVRWLKNRLRPWVSEEGIKFKTSQAIIDEKSRVQHTVGFESILHSVFVEYRISFYQDYKKLIPDNVADFMTPVSLAVWYMDNGELKNGATLWTTDFSEREEAILRMVLENKFNLETKIGVDTKKDGKSYRYISVNRDQWFALVGEYVWRVASMRHKVPKGFNPFGVLTEPERDMLNKHDDRVDDVSRNRKKVA